MYKTVEFRNLSDQHRISYPVGQYKFKEIKRQNWEENWDKIIKQIRSTDGTNVTHKNAAVRTGVPKIVSIFWHLLNIVGTL